MPKIVIIGESGQLAQSLRRRTWPSHCELDFVGRGRMAGPGAIEALKPDLILNAAAYTSVDRAESEPEAAASLNADLPRALAVLCGARDIPLVHVSTDYVFDGEKPSPYLESDPPNPIGVYGASKLAGDQAIEQAGLRRWAILRASWVISELGETFPVKLLRRARQGEPLRVVDDQRGCPTAADELARAMRTVGLMLLDRDPAAGGLFNFCGASAMTWHELADRLLAEAEAQGLKRVPLQAITSAELQAPARRPRNSMLDCDRIAERCGITGAGIEGDVPRMVRRILAA